MTCASSIERNAIEESCTTVRMENVYEMRKYDEELKCSEGAEVQVVESKRRLQAQVATIIIVEFDSANQGQDLKRADSKSNNKTDIESGLSMLSRVESYSNNRNRKLVSSGSDSNTKLKGDQKQQKAKIDSTNQMSDPYRVGQLKPRPAINISPLHSPPIDLKPLLSHLKYAYLDNDQQFPVIIANNLHREQEGKLL
ncbi:hypothetical protein CR513_49395, partial [Mucuna pruriens]